MRRRHATLRLPSNVLSTFSHQTRLPSLLRVRGSSSFRRSLLFLPDHQRRCRIRLGRSTMWLAVGSDPLQVLVLFGQALLKSELCLDSASNSSLLTKPDSDKPRTVLLLERSDQTLRLP